MTKPRKPRQPDPGFDPAAPDALLGERREIGEVDDLFRQMKKALMERALAGELTHHLGYAPGEAKLAAQPNHVEVAVWHDRRMGTVCAGAAILLSLRQSVPFAAPFGSCAVWRIAPFGSCAVSRLRSLAVRALGQFAPFDVGAVAAVWHLAPLGSSRRRAPRAVGQYAPLGSMRRLAPPRAPFQRLAPLGSSRLFALPRAPLMRFALSGQFAPFRLCL
jgi:hypothetical protein